MKAFFLGLLILVIVIVGGYVGLKYFYKPSAIPQTSQTATITKTGILQKSTIAQSDFTHVIVNPGGSVGVASYTLNLDDYIGKNVSASGQFSGDTLYADTVTIIP
jgi:uncharacterized protein (UPF0333 family)